MSITIPEIILGALATYRLTRLITQDRITLRIREFIEARSDFFGYLVSCDWCASIWVMPITATLTHYAHSSSLAVWILMGLSFSALTGLLAGLETRLDD